MACTGVRGGGAWLWRVVAGVVAVFVVDRDGAGRLASSAGVGLALVYALYFPVAAVHLWRAVAAASTAAAKLQVAAGRTALPGAQSL